MQQFSTSTWFDAISVNNIEKVKELLDQGINVNIIYKNHINEYGWAALHIAVHKGHTDLVALLIKHGADMYQEGMYIGAPEQVIKQIAFMDYTETEILKSRHLVGIDTRPLHEAIAGNHIDIVKLFLAHGIDITMQDYHNLTALHHAAKYGCLEIVHLLLAAGADVHAKDRYNFTPLDYAVANKNMKIAELLVDSTRDTQIKRHFDWYNAVIHNDIKQVKTLLAQDVDINSKVPYDPGAALHIAIREDYQELVELLIEYGADVDVKDAFGDTPLHYAADNCREKIFELLIESGAAPYDSTLLHIASGRGQEKIMQLAIEHGADVNAKDAFGSPPLHYAAYNNRAKAVELLITSGAAVNAKEDDTDRAALHYAAEFGCTEVVQLLLASGADMQATCFDGRTPLHIAAFEGHKKIVELLVAKDAMVNAKDKDCKTAYMLAWDEGHTDIAQFLEQYEKKQT